MTSLIGQQIIAIHILPNISRSKGSKPDNKIWSVNKIQHEKYFVEKSYTKCDGEASSRSFYKKLKLGISLDQQFEML